MSRRPLFQEIRRSERARELCNEAMIGVVTDNKDPDKLGRVKVKLPALLTSDTEDTTIWAPISSLGAGKDRGWFFLPEIDDEVLVMFEHGDTSRPVVLGALWNGKDKPPDQNGGNNERRMIYSRSGHKVELDDDAGTITFTDGDGVGKVVISDDKIEIETTGDCATQSPQGDTNIIANDISLKGSKDLTIKAGQDLKITGSGLTIDGGGKLDLVGAKVDINPPGGPAAASEASGSCESTPDPVGG